MWVLEAIIYINAIIYTNAILIGPKIIIFIHKNPFENVVWKMAAISFRFQYVNRYIITSPFVPTAISIS